MNIAVVTGASSGIGKEFVRQIDQRAHFDEIWVIARSEERLKILEKKLKTKIRVLAFDLTKPDSIEEYRSILRKENPNVKLLINAAGFGKIGAVNEISMEDITQMIALNITASVQMTQVTLPYMKPYSNIINMASSSAFQPLPNLNVYASTKAFILHYTNALQVELKNRRIVATAVCPGWVQTNFVHVAKETRNPGAVKKFPFMVKPRDVVSKAFQDAKQGKQLSIYGLPTNLQYYLAKWIPKNILMKLWLFISK